MANLSAVVERESRVLLADNNAHPNPASSLQNEVLGIGLNGKGWGWLDWARFGVEQFGNLVNLGYVHMDLNLKLAVLGDPNLECIRKYQYQSSLSISLYLNINTRMNPSPTGIGYL